MKLVLNIDQYYSSGLTKAGISDALAFLGKENKFGGLRTDRFIASETEDGFVVERNTYGLDFFTIERYPPITCNYISEDPVVLNIRIRPNYFTIIFLSFMSVAFMLSTLLASKMTINCVYKTPSIPERLVFIGFSLLPALWCYFGYLRPIQKAEKWITEKLNLTAGERN